MASASSSDQFSKQPPSSVLRITDLPVEVQRTVLRHLSTSDLTAVALVSKHFHSIASAELYRSFQVVFSDDDDGFDSPIGGLAGRLDALVTSEHDYAKYLKQLSMDSYSGGDRGERAYKPYSYELSCGRFMNTLLYLALKRARALEKFHWNIRVELSRAAFKELHKIPSLQELHVRLQPGPSLFRSPQPFASDASPVSAATPASSHGASTTTATPAVPPAPTHRNASSKRRSSPKGTAVPQPSTFAGFHHLSSLAVLDIDSLDYIPEIAACIRSCSSTLTTLKLSLSESMAMKARKPALEDSDESDIENDEFDNPLNQSSAPLTLGGAETSQEKEARRKTERATQEAILGKLFGLEKDSPAARKDDPKGSKGLSDSAESKLNAQDLPAYKASIENVVGALTSLLTACKNVPIEELHDELPLWAVIQDVAQKMVKVSGTKSVGFIDGDSGKANGEPVQKAAAAGASNKTGDENAGPKENGASETANASTQETSSKSPNDSAVDDSSALEAKSAPPKTDGTSPEDIDLDHPDVVDDEDAEPQEFVDERTHPTEPSSENHGSEPVVTNGTDVAASKVENSEAEAGVVDGSEVATAAVKKKASEGANHEPESLTSTAGASQTGGVAKAAKSPSLEDPVKEYIRSTRKLALQSFSLYLIPIKASTIYRAIDIYALHRITLLNVGPQAPLWRQMLIMHRSSPVNLRSIHTDDVTVEFLLFVSDLKSLEEIFLLERSTKSKVVSLTDTTLVGIKNIRRQILKKHMRTLKRLMIKNENDYGWDVDEKTMRLITRKGGKLTELAISLGLRSFHLLLQYFPGLSNLKALHLLNFRTDDTCHWVMRELRKFAMDNVAHHPRMKLEYIALEGTVESLVRKKPDKGKRPKTTGKAAAGKSKASSETGSSDDDSGTDDPSPTLKIETLEGISFHEVEGVKIFRKDIRAGRL